MKVRWASLIAIVLLSVVQAAPANAADVAGAKALYEEGVKQYNLGDFEAALEAYKKAYLAKPSPAFLFNIGQCQRNLGRNKDAEYSYRRYLASAPDAKNRAEVEQLLSEMQETLGRGSPVAQGKSPKNDSDSDPDVDVARRRFKEGVEFYNSEGYEKALQSFESAREAKSLPAFDFNIARCLDRLGRWDEAVVVYERFVKSGPSSDDAKEAGDRLQILKDRLAARVSPASQPLAAPVAAQVREPVARPVEQQAADAAAPSPAAAATTPRGNKPLGAALLGIGGALAIVGAALDGVGASFHAPDYVHYEAGLPAAQSESAAGVVLIAVGGAALLGGIVALVLPARSTSKAQSLNERITGGTF